MKATVTTQSLGKTHPSTCSSSGFILAIDVLLRPLLGGIFVTVVHPIARFLDDPAREPNVLPSSKYIESFSLSSSAVSAALTVP